MQNSLIWTWNTSLHRSQPLSVIFRCKIATFGPELQVSMGPRHHLSLCAFKTAWCGTKLHVSMCPRHPLSFCAFKTARFATELQVSVGPRPHLSFCACKTACLASEILVSMCPSLHLWLFDVKQGLLDQNCKSLWDTDLTCRFVLAKQRA